MIIKNLLATEKSVRMIDKENVITFMVDNKASKKEIKEEVEKLFNVKVLGVRTHSDKKGKRAFVRIDPKTPAMDIATQMGMI
jgi:large subunit ribosomal protein L23